MNGQEKRKHRCSVDLADGRCRKKSTARLKWRPLGRNGPKERDMHFSGSAVSWLAILISLIVSRRLGSSWLGFMATCVRQPSCPPHCRRCRCRCYPPAVHRACMRRQGHKKRERMCCGSIKGTGNITKAPFGKMLLRCSRVTDQVLRTKKSGYSGKTSCTSLP